MPRIAAIGTALPPYSFAQEEVEAKVRELFSGQLDGLKRLLGIFEKVQVRRRFFCVPLEWFSQPHSFTETNREYIRWAETLSIQAIENCLTRAKIPPARIDHLVFVSTSGLATPSLDARIIERLGLSAHVRRVPIFGLGCAGGAMGLAHCSALARGAPHQRILMVNVELSSLTFQNEDFRKSNLVASALFSDGASAVLISGDRCCDEGIELLDSMSTLWSRTNHIMGWEFGEEGFRLVFSPEIPDLLQQHFSNNVSEFLDHRRLTVGDLDYFAFHPGGTKILNILQESLLLRPEALEASRFVLNNYGNMSSATVLFVLDRLNHRHSSREDKYGLCAAFGPGFSSELLLLKWPSGQHAGPPGPGPCRA